MSTPAKINFKLYQGSTFNEVLRWESSVKTYATITNISKAAPVVVTAPSHGAPNEWRVKFTNIVGMVELNSTDTYYQATSVTANTITINDINSLGFKSYTSGGVVEYNTPVDLTGFTAKLQARNKIEDVAYIFQLTSQEGNIILDNINKTITINISAETTANYNFSSILYGLELTSSGGQVTLLCTGTITLVKEVVK